MPEQSHSGDDEHWQRMNPRPYPAWQGGPPPGMPPRASRNRKALWVVGGAVVTALVLVILVAVLGRVFGKSDITQLNSSMLVTRTSFPDQSGLELREPKIDLNYEFPGAPVVPPDCLPLAYGPPATQQATVGTVPLTKAAIGRAYSVTIQVAAEQPDLRNLVEKCGTYLIGDQSSHVTNVLEALPSEGLAADSAVLFRVTEFDVLESITALGYVRGVFVRAFVVADSGVTLSEDDIQGVVRLFNDQSARLEAV